MHHVHVTAANVADVTQVDKLLHGEENMVSADAGFNIGSPEIVAKLLTVINITTEHMITLPNKMGGIYADIPAGAHDQINGRDS